MQLPFRKKHIILILIDFEKQKKPLDLFLSNYFRSNKSIGSKDRKEIAETIYILIRYRGLIDAFLTSPISWEDRLSFFNQNSLSDLQSSPNLKPHVKVSFPKILFEQIEKDYGTEEATRLCHELNIQAPTTIRINTLKTSRNALFEKWKDQYDIEKTKNAPNGIHFKKKINFFATPEFKNGLFEIQDEGSQLLANLVECKPSDLVFDYCAGSGGKTLAFAPRMDKKGQIFLHDIRDYILLEAKKRLKRADIQNAQIVLPYSKKLKTLKNKMDWVLVDAPCSGSGTYRRNPDMKWKYRHEDLINLCSLQKEIFETALSFVKDNGKIVYATCSLFLDENQRQVDYFLKKHNLKLEKTFQSFPQKLGSDGFFGAVFTKKT
ncbi:MAG TPA: RsmB/NOP family class I SAM-dependent RNA methyltransferase [Chlamydiales bacterium]|nr:RsmB/NOP family class I SAM-dependent RNA methyltransferase [Chlamydiales bacterium]